MAALQCEICGGKLIGKPGGVFECDSCGMEYSTEWAKAKVQEIKGTVKIEGPVEVTGTVKVEGGASVDSLLKQGWMTLEDSGTGLISERRKSLSGIMESFRRATELFRQVLTIDSQCAEAYLGLAMAASMSDTRDTYVQKYLSVAPGQEDKNLLRAKQFAKGELKEWLEDLEARRKMHQDKAGKEREQTIPRLAARRAELAKAAGLVTFNAYVKTDGTVVETGYSTSPEMSNWRDIVALDAYIHTVGLKSDGTVVAVGRNDCGQCDVSGWRDIVSVVSGYECTLGLTSGGTVVTAGKISPRCSKVSGWQDIVSLVRANNDFMGLKADGTVVTTVEGASRLSSWRDIVALAAGEVHIVGLKSDGTVIATSMSGLDLNVKMGDVSDWRDIVAIGAGKYYTVGLKADGTVVSAGHVFDVPQWTDIVAIVAGVEAVLGLKSDGTVVCTAEWHKCDDYKLFNSFESLEQEREEAKAERKRQEAERQRQEAEAKAKAEAERQAKIAALEAEKASIQAELPNLKGLFSGSKRRELEARLAEIEKELKQI